jgi:formate C-acetyltransferase
MRYAAVQLSAREADLLPADRRETGADFPRLARLRQALLDAPYGLCTQKAALMTEYFRTHTRTPVLTQALAAAHFAATRRALASNLGTGRPQSRWQTRLSNALQRLYTGLETERSVPLIVQFARALAYTLAHEPLRVYEDELIVGNLTSQRIGAAIHPDFGGLLLLPELLDLEHRSVNPLRVSAEQVRELEEDILPYWFSRSVMARAPMLARDPELQNTLMRGRDFILTQFAGISHVTPDYQAVLEKGFNGIVAAAEEASARSRSADQRAFYEAASIVARAAIDFGRRWSRHCAAQAELCSDPQRADELRNLARIFERVPAQPANTFHEAVQSLFLAHVIVHQESFQHGVSFGRVDRMLFPYYARDRAAGRLTREQAVEILGCFLGKAAEQVPLFNSMATEFFSGLSSASGLTLGGLDSAGNDATNELSYLFLEAYDRMRLRQPNLHLRVHRESPPKLRARAYEVLKKGGGMPALFNDDAVLPAIQASGVSLADARDYSIVGCVEWGVPRKSFPAAGAAFLSLPAVLDDTLHPRRRSGKAATSFASMDEFLAAFRRQLRRTIQSAVAGNDAIERAHALFRPTPLLSLLVTGCLETGRDVTAGGARYNSTGIQGVGLADVADSLAAIEQLVFAERRLSLAQLAAAVDSDFEGQEQLRSRLVNKVAKYGEDAGRAEHYAACVARLFCDTVREHVNPRGGPYAPGFWSMTTHVGFGRRLGALPSGRRAGRPLADGISPVNGCDRRGPTASLLAAARVGGDAVGNGLALNEKLDPRFVEGESGTRLMDGLTRGYFDAGGMQVQYNIIDPRVLIDAKRHPERHRDLVVRISGYSAYFNDLTEEMKDDIIARTLHGAATASGPACHGY